MALSCAQKYSYGIGHVLNDLCSTLWFAYVLIFLNKVLLINSGLSGTLVFIGELTDAVVTPFVGFFSDRGDGLRMCKYGKRKTWHLVGTVLVSFSFPFIFSPSLITTNPGGVAEVLYYTLFICLFEFGFPFIQITHLSLVPQLTPVDDERTSLLAIRHSFSVFSSMIVYVLLWIALQAKHRDANAPITPKDLEKFQIVAYSVVAMGTIMSLIFHLGTEEPARELLISREESEDILKVKERSSSTVSLFGNVSLYKMALLFMSTRMVSKISQAFFPLYLQDYLHLGGHHIATLPLVTFAFGFAMSTIIRGLNKHFGRKIAYCFGTSIATGVAIWVRFDHSDLYKTYMIYIVAALCGIATSTLTVTSLGIVADFIGQDSKNSAFVYGLMSFCDKLSCGTVIMAIETWPCFPSCSTHYRDSLAYVCGGAAVLGTITILSMPKITCKSTGICETTERLSI